MPTSHTDSFNKLLSEKIVWDVIESTADAVVTIDEAHRIVYCNAAAEKMFGYGRGELDGTDVSPLVPAPHQGRHRGYVDRYIQTRKPRVLWQSREGFGQKKDGTTFPVEISYSVSQTEGGLYFTAVIRDTSERKKMERDLRFMEKLADVGKAVASVVHEIRKPLMLIGGFARQVADCGALQGSEKDRHKLGIIAAEVQRLETLLSTIRLLARPPSSGEKCGVLVGQLLQESLDLLDPMLQGRDIALSVELSGERLPVTADADQLKQVFLNLMQNAAEAIEGAGEIRIVARQNGPAAEISITDDGCGIPAELTDKIFDPFFTTKREGTGLGLAICKNIVQDHGGELIVESAPGRGTSFRIRLPLQR